jgi:hypothetical protein
MATSFIRIVLFIVLFLPNVVMAQEEKYPLTPPDVPVKVNVGLTITEITDVDEKNSTFKATGYFTYEWIDKRIAYKPKHELDTLRFYDENNFWTPQLDFENAIDLDNQFVSTYRVAPNGKVFRKKRFAGLFNFNEDLKKFPFDKQVFQINIQPLLYDSKHEILVVNNKHSKISSDVKLDEWSFDSIAVHSKFTNGDPTSENVFSRITLSYFATRHWQFYAWKVLFPLVIFLTISCCVFWINPEQLETNIAIGITMLLTVVAFDISLEDRIPSIPYRTFLDDFNLLCVVVMLVNILMVVFAHRSITVRNHIFAERVFFNLRWIVPSLFFLGVTVLVFKFYFF